MKIYIARHAKDEDGYRGGWSMRGLTDEGKIQAELLADYLYDDSQMFNIKTILSSDLKRAKETVLPISEKLGVKVDYLESLRETNNGDLAGLQNDFANKEYPGIYFNTLAMDERYPNGESPNEFFCRINKLVKQLIMNVETGKLNSNVLLITHGGVINVIYHVIKRLEWSNRVKPFPCNYTSLHCIEYDGNEWKVVEENNYNHLEK